MAAGFPGAPAERALRLGALAGDGIGPEIVRAAVAVVDAATAATGARVDWEWLPMGLPAIASHGTAIPDSTLAALERLDGWVLGPHDSAAYPEPHRAALNPSGRIRTHFDLFANIRPARVLGASSAIVPGTDLVVVRENTEGFYADRNTFAGTGEMMPTPDVAIAHGIITREASTRIAHEAFRLARARRGRVTVVHKANVLRLTSGLFREACHAVAAEYPGVTVDELHIDAAAARLVRHADEFDVIVTENMFGDILSDLAGEIAGSLGIAPSLNASGSRAMAQAAHGSAPAIAGLGIANPTAMMLSAAMLLEWLGDRGGDRAVSSAATAISGAVESVIGSGISTPDLGGSASTDEFAGAVAAAAAELGAAHRDR